MANYLSLGQCCKIGYEFEKNRTGTRCCNNICYVMQGLKVFCCECCCFEANETIPLKELIDYTAIIKEQRRRSIQVQETQ